MIFIVTGLNWFCNTYESTGDVKTYASLNDTVKYVGINTCKECHSQIYDSYILTGMGKSFDNASKSKSAANFSYHKPVYDAHLNFYYFPFWENDSLRILEYRVEGLDTVHKRIETISYIVGSGQHTNSHLINTNGYLTQAPLTFYTQSGKWDLPPGFENGGNTRFDRLIGLECISCHNSFPEFVEGSQNKFKFIDNGINCERCHGPGEVHVNNMRTGKTVNISEAIDYSIVNPAKLPISLQLDICQRCHIQGNAVLNDDKSFFDFKPGMKLSDVMNVFMPVFKGRSNEHIMASHVERLKMSKCYIKSLAVQSNTANTLYPYKNALTCVTCHDPHVSVTQKSTDKFNITCKSCHPANGKVTCTEDPNVLLDAGNNCIKCHMPGSGTIDIPHVTVHDHLIGIPVTDKKTDEIRKFIGIKCINNKKAPAKARARAFIAYYEKFNFNKEALDSAKIFFTDDSEKEIQQHFHELIQIAYLEKDYNKIVGYCNRYPHHTEQLKNKSYNNKDAWTAYRIGEAYIYTGNASKAVKYFELAYKLAPLYFEFANKYGSALVNLNMPDEALKIFDKLVGEFPSYAPAWSNLGFTSLLAEGDTVYARKCYDRSLSLNPDNIQALLNKSGLLTLQGDTLTALYYAKLVIARDSENAKAVQILKRLQRK
jgi:Flp pilus assembly protein TadD